MEKEVLNRAILSSLDPSFRTSFAAAPAVQRYLSFALRRDATATCRSGASFACALIQRLPIRWLMDDRIILGQNHFLKPKAGTSYSIFEMILR
ncbi:MAG: hypothetical protein ACRDBP_16055 [Luteolibacter sp.]